MSKILRVVFVAAALCAFAIPQTGTAKAESYAASCYSDNGGNVCYGTPPATSGLDLAARARYSDETDDLCVADRQKDGRSAVGVYWPAGQPGKKARLWNRSGSGATVCTSLHALPENASYRIQVCLGEWAPRPANRLIIACGPSRPVLL